MADIQCSAELETFLNDFELFINGDKNSDVTLHDGTIMPSYQKYSLSQMNKTAAAYDFNFKYSKGDLVSYNGKAYIADKNVEGVLPTDQSFWTLLEEPAPKFGYGFEGMVTFDLRTGEIIRSKYVNSVEITNEEYITIEFNQNMITSSSGRVIWLLDGNPYGQDLTDISKKFYDGTLHEDKKYELHLFSNETKNSAGLGIVQVRTNRTEILQHMDMTVEVMFLKH